MRRKEKRIKLNGQNGNTIGNEQKKKKESDTQTHTHIC